MIAGQLRRTDDDTPLLETVYRTTTALERMRGLLGRAPLGAGEAMLIDRCGSVHALGMRYRLGLAFMTGGGRVLKLVHGLRPGRASICLRASMTLEMPPGSITATGLAAGDVLHWHAHAAP